MNKVGRTAVVVGLLAIGAAVAYYVIAGGSGPTTTQKADEAPPPVTTKLATGLPRLVDLGAGKCIPCKMMAPILEELKKEYAGRLKVEFIDVWVNPEAGKPYGIKLIPTQIFYDAAGKERFRHEGFMAKEDILAKWKELGFDFNAASKT
ncbi:MAG: thioredoxin family protein [Planctomycetota bacterium]|nr:thioredoxin family protein [Planctomycetota bacterium]